jgi:transcriptional regulator GlxA family with amidase domain
MRPRIGILGYDGIQALDLVGPAEAFASVTNDNGTRAYDIVVIGLDGTKFESETGLTMHADTTIRRPGRLDTLIVPGGRTLRLDATQTRAAAWIKSRAPGVRRIASVCTGAYALAAAGLLDGRRVATHWRHVRDLSLRFPKLRVESDAIYIRDGKYYTSAGITAGIDLALALIEEDRGPSQALAVARELVVFLKRDGGQDQFSQPLAFQSQAVDRFADLTAWIAGHLSADLSVEALAQRTFLSPRQFSRVFKAELGMTPAAFVEELRMGEACRRLAERRVTVSVVAASLGYRSDDVFRRAFERRFGVSPGMYRRRFQWTPKTAR